MAKPNPSSGRPWWAWSDQPRLMEPEEREEGEEREVGAAAWAAVLIIVLWTWASLWLLRSDRELSFTFIYIRTFPKKDMLSAPVFVSEILIYNHWTWWCLIIMLSPAPPFIQVHHFCHLDDPPEPTPLVTPPQSSDDEEVMSMINMCVALPWIYRGDIHCEDVYVVWIYRMYVHTYHRLPARLRHLVQLGLAHRLLGNSPYTLHFRLLGNSPIIPPSQHLRALPPSPAICLPTWTLSMLSLGPPLTWVRNMRMS